LSAPFSRHQSFDVLGVGVGEFRDGKLVRGTEVFDVADMLRQSKVLPPQGSRAERRMMRLLNLQTKLRRLRRR
jgi:hypothetical protein